ncbi:MAG TPA: hypothetical protein VFT50_00650 [Baekduia sp.]|nr:hypothetical protein [Baekduia sp.]
MATCIACGARSRAGECPEGCADVAIDLVDLAALEAVEEHAGALRERVEALRGVLAAAGEAPDDEAWRRVREAAARALHRDVPEPPEVEVVPAWGCPSCGRVDAPQPCLGVCIRRPVLMVDAARVAAAREESERLAERDGVLTAVVRMLATVRPRPGQEARTREALRERAREALAPPPDASRDD